MQLITDNGRQMVPPFGTPASLTIKQDQDGHTFYTLILDGTALLSEPSAEMFALHFLQHKKGLTGWTIRRLLALRFPALAEVWSGNGAPSVGLLA